MLEQHSLALIYPDKLTIEEEKLSDDFAML